MAEANNKILTHMLERLFAGMLSGPNLNCRPHSSRQREGRWPNQPRSSRAGSLIVLAYLDPRFAASSEYVGSAWSHVTSPDGP